MNMRERIARAIADDIGDGSVLWDLYLDTADAVLAAMAEPTRDMLNAGYDAVQEDIGGDWIGKVVIQTDVGKRVLLAMLAAAGEPE